MINLKRKIKIIYILPTLNIGGAELFTIDLIRNLNKNKFIVGIVCLKDFEENFLEKNVKELGIPLLRINKKGRFDILSFYILIKYLLREKPDLVHTQLFAGDLYGTIAAKIVGIKHIISTEQINIHNRKIEAVFKRLITPLRELVIAPSKAVKESLTRYDGVKEVKIKVIPNAVDISKFYYQDRDYKINNKKIFIGSAGRLSREKGFGDLIEAISKIKKEDIYYLIAGEGDLRNELLAKIENLRLESKIQLLGRQEDIIRFFKVIDIFILPSKWEAFGNVIIEAGCSGLPVIASNVGGIKEIIINNNDGLLFESGNVLDLVSKIEYLIDNWAERRRLGANLQRKVIMKYGIKKIVKEYENIYFDLVKN
jgi:glycosyltransferase involved in cell wall biosynthesis